VRTPGSEARRTWRTKPPSRARVVPFAEGREDAAGFDEALELAEAGPADAAGDVVRGGGDAVAGIFRRGGEGHRTGDRLDAVDLGREIEIDVAVDDHVDPVAEAAGADVLVAQVEVGNACRSRCQTTSGGARSPPPPTAPGAVGGEAEGQHPAAGARRLPLLVVNCPRRGDGPCLRRQQCPKF
jgi:hypothetical protein